jgi:hypothetical protein
MATVEKRGVWAQKINSETRGEFFSLLLRHNICPEDFGKLERHQDEVVCSSCGYVSQHDHFSSVIPFGSENSPGNLLAEGHHGNTLGEKGLWANLAKQAHSTFKCPGCGMEFNDLPVRARQIMILSTRHEHPRIATLLRLARKLSEDWGYADDKGSNKSVVFSNYFGRMVRKVGSFLVVQNVRLNSTKVVQACFTLTLKDLYGMNKYSEAKTKLALEDRFLEQIGLVYQVMVMK